MKIDTTEQIADMFTKAVRKDVLRKHSVTLGLVLPQHALICTICLLRTSAAYMPLSALSVHNRQLGPYRAA